MTRSRVAPGRHEIYVIRNLKDKLASQEVEVAPGRTSEVRLRIQR